MSSRLRWTFAALCLALVSHARCETALPPGSQVLDGDLIYYGRLGVSISPDGQGVAYESAGSVWIVEVTGGTAPRSVGELPDTWSDFMARPENAHAEGNLSKLMKGLDRRAYRELIGKVRGVFAGFYWLPDSRAVCWSSRPNDAVATSYWLATSAGDVELLARIEDGEIRGRESWGQSRRAGPSGVLTRDRRYFVTRRFQRPVIWDVVESRPRATPFDCLTPSPSSDRWIGIEKDSRQLVITDADFSVIQRFEEWMPARTFGFDLKWSPEERYVLWRNQIGFDYYSNWEGAWFDLQTGTKQEIEGWFFREEVAFTGQGGEFLRFGAEGKRRPQFSGNIVTGAHLTLYPGAGGDPTHLWRREYGDANHSGYHGLYPSQLVVDSLGNRFVFAMTQSLDDKPRPRWRLTDRSGAAWPLPFDDQSLHERTLPYTIVGFADGGRILVGYDKNRLFTMPVEAIVRGPGQLGQ